MLPPERYTSLVLLFVAGCSERNTPNTQEAEGFFSDALNKIIFKGNSEANPGNLQTIQWKHLQYKGKLNHCTEAEGMEHELWAVGGIFFSFFFFTL